MENLNDNYTDEQIRKHIDNCFHSYVICEDLSQESNLDEETQDKFDRNKEHIQIMYAKDWFKNGLSDEENNKLKKYI